MHAIGIMGRIGSGKDEVAGYLEDICGIPALDVGDAVREVTARTGVEPTRENLHDISKRFTKRYGRDYFVRKVIDRVERTRAGVVCITGIRTPEDVDALHEHFGDGLLLVWVHTDPHLRYLRLRERGEARDPRTFPEFMRQEREEDELFGIEDAATRADLVLDNNGDVDELQQRIEQQIIRGALSGALYHCHARRTSRPA